MVLLFSVTSVTFNCLPCLFVHVPGFTEAFLNKTVPEILFVNTDGYLPEIQVYTDGNSSYISFRTCQRISEKTDAYDVENNNAFDSQPYDVNFPFIVLTPDDEEVL